jgi:hypothetical protein
LFIITGHWNVLDKEVGDDVKYTKPFVVLDGKVRKTKRDRMNIFYEYNEEAEGIFCKLLVGKLDAGGMRTWYLRNTK